MLKKARCARRCWLGPIPTDVHVEPWVSQGRVFRHAAVVVCHGGSGTTLGATDVARLRTPIESILADPDLRK